MSANVYHADVNLRKGIAPLTRYFTPDTRTLFPYRAGCFIKVLYSDPKIESTLAKLTCRLELVVIVLLRPPLLLLLLLSFIFFPGAGARAKWWYFIACHPSDAGIGSAIYAF